MPRNTVALGIRPPDPAAAAVGSNINPFQAGVDIMRMQQLANENRQFQMKQQAYQNLSGIAVQHPGDEEGMFREMMASPWAPWGIDYINTARQSFLAMTQAQEAQARTGETNLKANDSAMQTFTKFMVPYYTALKDPNTTQDQLDGIAQGALERVGAVTSNMSKSQRDAAVNGVKGWFDSQFLNLPSDPTARRQALINRMGSSFAGAGFTEHDFSNILFGAPYQVGLGNVEQFGVRGPTMSGGMPQPAGNLPIGVAPGRAAPGEVPYPPIAPGASMAPGATALPSGDLGLPPGVMPPNQLGGQPPAPPPPPSQSPVQPPPAVRPAPRIGADGSPLWDDKTDFGGVPHLGHMDASGTRWVWTDPDAAKNAADSMAKFRDVDTKELVDSNRSLTQLDYMDHALDTLAGTPLEPGTAGPQRLEIARGYNTAVDTLHSIGIIPDDKFADFKFNERSIQAGEALTKAQTLAQFATVTQSFGAQREAAQIIMRALGAVPGMDISYMGNKLVLESLKQAAYRIQDLNDFKLEWIRRQGGLYQDLTGAEQEFNRIHPASEYVNRVLEAQGMGPNGFTSQAAINNAVTHGYITPDMAAAAAKKLPAERPETVTSP